MNQAGDHAPPPTEELYRWGANPYAQVGRPPGLTFPLYPGFRYVHEPLRSAAAPIPFLGHHKLVSDVAERIRHSDGGAFLIGGFRGSGKSTMIQQVTEVLSGPPSERTYVFVTLNIARPVSSNEFLFKV